MKITLESTEQMVQVHGVAARVWRGHTARGVEIHAMITRIAVLTIDDCSQFEAELSEQRAPRDAAADVFPLRLVL